MKVGRADDVRRVAEGELRVDVRFAGQGRLAVYDPRGQRLQGGAVAAVEMPADYTS